MLTCEEFSKESIVKLSSQQVHETSIKLYFYEVFLIIEIFIYLDGFFG